MPSSFSSSSSGSCSSSDDESNLSLLSNPVMHRRAWPSPPQQLHLEIPPTDYVPLSPLASPGSEGDLALIDEAVAAVDSPLGAPCGTPEAKRPTASSIGYPYPPSQPPATLDAPTNSSSMQIITRPIFSPSPPALSAAIGHTTDQAIHMRTTGLTTPCLPGQPSANSGFTASNAVVDPNKRIKVFREPHPGVSKKDDEIDVSMQEGRASVTVGTNDPIEMTRGKCKVIEMTRGKCKGGWHVYCGSAVKSGSKIARKGYLCRICYTSYLGKTSYNDIQENCPFFFLRLYDLSNKYRAGHRASTTRTHARTAIKPNVSSAVHPTSVEDRGGGSAACAVTRTSLPAHTGVVAGSYLMHTAAIRCIVHYLNLRFPDCLDLLYVYDNFSKYVFLRNGTLQPTGRRFIGIVEYVKNGQLKWGVLKRFLGFRYDGIQPIDSVECKHPETSSASASATTTCEYFSSTWVPRPRAIIAALKLSGFDDPRINGVYVFAGYRPRTPGRKARRNQDCAYFQSTSGLRLFPDDLGHWHVCNDDRVLASSSNIKAVWNPGRKSLHGGWVLREAAHNVLTDRWDVPGITPSDSRNKCLMSECRPLDPEEEYALKDDNLRAINEMKTLHAFGVAMGGERESNCKFLQWNPKAGSTRQDDNVRMKTPQVRLQTCDWRDPKLRERVGDLVFVENEHRARLQAAGSNIFVFDPNDKFLCNGRMYVPHSQFFVVHLLKSDIPHADGCERNSCPSKRGSNGSFSRDNVKRTRQ